MSESVSVKVDTAFESKEYIATVDAIIAILADAGASVAEGHYILDLVTSAIDQSPILRKSTSNTATESKPPISATDVLSKLGLDRTPSEVSYARMLEESPEKECVSGAAILSRRCSG